MCFKQYAQAIDPLNIFHTRTTMAEKANQAAQKYQWDAQLHQQGLVNQAITDQFNETLSRQQQAADREKQSANSQAQTAIVYNQQAQATAMASASTAGITGTPLQTLFGDYQHAIGNVSNNLMTSYQQINENTFFNNENSRLQANSNYNSATPVAPYTPRSTFNANLVNGINTGVKYGTMIASLASGNPAGAASLGSSTTAKPSTQNYNYSGWDFQTYI